MFAIEQDWIWSHMHQHDNILVANFSEFSSVLIKYPNGAFVVTLN